MPDFEDLARFVVEELGTPRDAPSWEMLSRWQDESVPAGARPSVDQIFNLLQQEYAASDIDYLIAKKLKTPRGANLVAHETILRLSRSSDGKPQIVTTNFDLPLRESRPTKPEEPCRASAARLGRNAIIRRNCLSPRPD